MAEISIDLTYDEVRVLTSALGLPLPVGVTEDDIEFPEAIAVRLAERARASLIARKILSVGGEVNHAVKAILDLIATPGLMLAVEVDTIDVIQTDYLLCDPDLGVHVDAIAPSVFRFTPFVTRDVIRRVIELTDLRPAEVPVMDPVRLSVEQVTRAADLADTDLAAATSYLAEQGVVNGASTLAAALGSRRRSVNITSLHRPGASVIEGGVVSWIDCGLNGNWLTNGAPEDAAESAGDDMVLQPVAAPAIVDELISYLPEAFVSFAEPSA